MWVPVRTLAKPSLPIARISYREPFDWRSFLRFLLPRLVSGVEAIKDDCYYRAVDLRGRT